MGRDDELRSLGDQVVHAPHQGEVPTERQRGFGLIEDIQAIWPEAVRHEGDERLSVRFLMQGAAIGACDSRVSELLDRKSTRLNSSHSQISYAVFCLKN